MGRSSTAPRLSTRTRARAPDPSYPTSAAATAAVTARKPRRCRLRRSILPGRDSGNGRRSGPATPLLRWKFDDRSRSCGFAPEEEVSERRKRGGGAGIQVVSARRLAAGIWHLQLPEIGCGGEEGRKGGVGAEHLPGHLQSTNFPLHGSYGIHASRTRKEFASPVSNHKMENVMLQKMEGCGALPNPGVESATKWDPGYAKASDQVCRFDSHLKLLEDQQVTTVSVVSALQSELEKAHTRISELEAERRSEKKKLDHFMRKHAEEKTTWRRREHEKVRAIIEDMKADLNREKKSRQRMEIVNGKLVNELAEVKLSAKKFMQEYEKERKAREVMEEVCDELAKEIGEDKAEVEALKRDSMKIREEVEEERKMLQMAEVWREERVQMKLIDAKLALEEKYVQLSKLQGDLEAFMRARGDMNPDEAVIREAEAIKEAVCSVKIQDMKEFTYQPPPASEDIFSVFEELQPRDDTCGDSLASHASEFHMVSPDINNFLAKPTRRYANGAADINGDVDDSGWETVSHIEEQGSSNSPGGSDPSVNGICEESNASVSGTDWEENGVHGRLNAEISEICPLNTRQSRKKASSIVRIWRSSSGMHNGENPKKISMETINGRLSNGRMSNATLSPDKRSGEIGLSPQSLAQWSSPDSLNPHITRGMKGCIEWPRGMQKHSLKAKLLEARMESQKIQLKQVLKQKF